MATSFPAGGCFLLLGSAPATASSLVATQAPPRRHVKTTTMLMFPAPAAGGLFLLSSKGSRLTVAAAGATVVTGGSADRPLFREAAASITFSSSGVHGALAGVELPRYGAIIAAKAQALPVGFLVSSSKGARLPPVVVAAGTTSPGESDDGELPSEDREAAASVFCMEMELFKISLRPVALVGSPTDLLMDGASGAAKECSEILDFLVAKVPVRRDTLRELITVGKSFLIVESQAKDGYVKADALANAINGAKLVAEAFFKGMSLPDYSAPVVPLSADDVDKDSFFKELINVFIVLYTALYWEADQKYDYRKGGAN